MLKIVINTTGQSRRCSTKVNCQFNCKTSKQQLNSRSDSLNFWKDCKTSSKHWRQATTPKTWINTSKPTCLEIYCSQWTKIWKTWCKRQTTTLASLRSLERSGTSMNRSKSSIYSVSTWNICSTSQTSSPRSTCLKSNWLRLKAKIKIKLLRIAH